MGKWKLDDLVTSGEGVQSFFVSDSTGGNSLSCLS